MNHAIQRLQSLTVVDVMSQDVLQVPTNQSMCSTARLLIDGEVSSAPVVDEQGHCVGILSATDFLKRECKRNESDETSLSADRHELVRSPGEQSWHIESNSYDCVSSYMTPAVQSVAADAPLLSAAKIMDAQHIHRLVVLDAKEHPIGVISTMDIVSALLNALAEMENELPTTGADQ